MLKYKVAGLAFFLSAFFGKLDFEASRIGFKQARKFYQIEKIGTVPLAEISGLCVINDTIYCLTDSGGQPALYALSQSLKILDTLYIPQAKNRDWEALTVDGEGTFYIGDYGNNRNTRLDLTIYKYEKGATDSISVRYSQQVDFPPFQDDMNFDSESLFWHEGKLHMFSKNRGKKCVKHYIVNLEEDTQTLTPTEELWMNRQITGAAVNDDIVALLGYGKIYFFKIEEDKIFDNPLIMIESTRWGQNEAITFLDHKTLLICNEEGEFFKISIQLP